MVEIDNLCYVKSQYSHRPKEGYYQLIAVHIWKVIIFNGVFH